MTCRMAGQSGKNGLNPPAGGSARSSTAAAGLFLLVGIGRNPQTEPGVSRRHHLYSHSSGIPLPGGHHGLVQPGCPGLSVQHPGVRPLCRRHERGSGLGRPKSSPQTQGSHFTGQEFTEVLVDERQCPIKSCPWRHPVWRFQSAAGPSMLGSSRTALLPVFDERQLVLPACCLS